MVEKTMIGIIAAVFVLSSWWWVHRQKATEDFYQDQLRQRDTVISQLCTLGLPLVQGKTPSQVQVLFRNIFPQYDVRYDDGVVFAGSLGVRFFENEAATDFYLRWEAAQQMPAQ